MLFQTDEDDWQQGILTHTAKGHENYDEFLKWSELQPRCWPTLREAGAAFEAETGKKVIWDLPAA